MKRSLFCLALASFTGVAPTLAATVSVDLTPGTGAPPATLGGYTMEAFPAEVRPDSSSVTTIAAPGSGVLDSGAAPLTIASVPSGGWSTWSHGYTGSVYYTLTSSLQFTLPANTKAFYFYLQPNNFSVFPFTVECGDATTSTIDIDGNGGATFVGFYATDPLAYLQSISIQNPGETAGGFAIGEFGIASVSSIPEPGSLLSVGALLVSGLLLRNRRSPAKVTEANA